MAKKKADHVRDRAEDSPTAWFVVLEHARNASDFERAAQALRELRRLGVFVRFTPAGQKDEAQHA
jgi:hypothetical protein